MPIKEIKELEKDLVSIIIAMLTKVELIMVADQDDRTIEVGSTE